MDDFAPKASAIDKFIPAIIASFATGAVVFAASYFYDGNKKAGIQETQLQVITTQVIELRGDVRAFQSNFVRREEINEVKDRLRDLERIERNSK